MINFNPLIKMEKKIGHVLVLMAGISLFVMGLSGFYVRSISIWLSIAGIAIVLARFADIFSNREQF